MEADDDTSGVGLVRSVTTRGMKGDSEAGGIRNMVVKGHDAPRTLFVDDGDIRSMVGVERVIHQARKHEGNPIVVPDRPWEDELLLGGTVLKEDGTYRMWYESHRNRSWLNLYADSDDGIHWTKPALRRLEDYDGNLDNNIYLSRVALRSDSASPVHTNQDHNQSVIQTPWMGDGHAYTMLSYDYGRSGYSDYDGYFLAFSDDGIVWTDGPEEPVIPGHSDVGWFTYDAQDRKFRGIVKTYLNIRGYSRRSVLWTESEDGFNWTMPRPAIVPDVQDEEWTEGREGHYTQMYGMPIFRYESVILGLLQIFQCTDGTGSSDGYLDVQLASSRDGRSWDRVGDRRPVLERGPDGAWDWGRVQSGNSLLIDGDEIKLYYMGFNCRHGGHGAGPEGKKVKIGLATWPLDRIVGLKAGASGGELRVASEPGGAELHVNTDAAGGSLVVELSVAGTPVPGFEAGKCAPIVEDSLDRVVRWEGGPSLASLSERPIEIGIRLTNAEVFSLWWE